MPSFLSICLDLLKFAIVRTTNVIQALLIELHNAVEWLRDGQDSSITLSTEDKSSDLSLLEPLISDADNAESVASSTESITSSDFTESSSTSNSGTESVLSEPNENNCLVETEINSKTTFTVDNARTETSTPIKVEKIDDSSWVSINLPPGSRDEHSLNECKDIISSMYYPDWRRNIFHDRELSLLDSKQEIEPSENVKEISLEAEDWKNLSSRMSKNHEDVVSLQNSMDDSESVKKESVSAENEDCNINTEVVVGEEVLNCDSVTKAQVEQPTNEQSNKELEEVTIPCSERKFNNINATITDNKINQDLDNAVFMCLQKETIVTEDKMPEDQTKFDEYQESYVWSNEDREETTLLLLKFFNEKLKLLDMNSNSSSSSESNFSDEYEKMKHLDSSSSTEDNFSDEGKSTPISNMEDLMKREELESIHIYDDFQVCDDVENGLISGDLSEEDQ